jgi:hypothetical protein
VVKLHFSGLCFEWVSMAKLHFNGLCFNGLYCAFQVEIWVNLRWCVHNDLCELNVVYYEMIGYVSKIIISCF